MGRTAMVTCESLCGGCTPGPHTTTGPERGVATASRPVVGPDCAVWAGKPPVPTPTIELPSIEPTADGFVGFCTIVRQQFEDFLVLIDHAELLADDELANATLRARRMDEFLGYVRPWTTQHTTAEIVERASALRIPVAPVLDGATVVGHEQFVERGSFVEGPHGFTQPRVPYRLGDRPRPGFGPAPTLGEHTDRILEEAGYSKAEIAKLRQDRVV